MLVMFEVTNPVERAHTMTKRQVKSEATEIKAILSGDDDFIRSAVRTAIQAALEAEMTEALAAERSERVDGRPGYRSGSYGRSLITRNSIVPGCFRPSCSSATSVRSEPW